MYIQGQKIIYGENGVCIIESIGPLNISDSSDTIYYHLKPLIGSGNFFAPIDTQVFMRPLISKDAALSLINSIPSIEPAICDDPRFNHVDAFYKEQFRLHTPEAMVSIIKGVRERMADKKTRSTRAEATIKRAKEILYGELSAALSIDYNEVENFIYANVDL